MNNSKTLLRIRAGLFYSNERKTCLSVYNYFPSTTASMIEGCSSFLTVSLEGSLTLNKT